jgi:hypothetical protein
MSGAITDEDVLNYAKSLRLAPAQLFPRSTVQEVKCPACRALPGMPCMNRGRLRVSNHLERVFERARLFLASRPKGT